MFRLRGVGSGSIQAKDFFWGLLARGYEVFVGYICNLANGYAWVLFLEQSHVHGELSQPYLINKQKFPRTKDGSRAPATDIPNSILGHFYLLVPIEGYLAGIPIPTANFEVLEVPLIC